MKRSLAIFQFIVFVLGNFAVLASDFNSGLVTLSADIGATNTRYVMLPKTMPCALEDMRSLANSVVCCESFRPLTTENLMKSLPECDGLQCISLGLPCPCEEGMPTIDGLKDLKENLSSRYGSTCQLALENDAVNWLKGTLAYQSRMQEKTKAEPTLLVVLGTAVGLVHYNTKALTPLELADFNFAFASTRKLLALDESFVFGKFARYLITGKYFFEDVNSNHLVDAVKRFKSEGEEARQYQLLVDAFLTDVVDGLLSEGYPIAKIIVAGGNTQYLDAQFEFDDKDVMILNTEKLDGIPPSLIPMLAPYFCDEAL